MRSDALGSVRGRRLCGKGLRQQCVEVLAPAAGKEVIPGNGARTAVSLEAVEQLMPRSRSSKIQRGAPLRTWIRSASDDIRRSAAISAALRVAWPYPCSET